MNLCELELYVPNKNFVFCKDCDYSFCWQFYHVKSCGYYKVVCVRVCSGEHIEYKYCADVNHDAQCKRFHPRRSWWDRFFGRNKPPEPIFVKEVY